MLANDIMNKAFEIRQLLTDEFPESPDLSKQCKRASILMDMWYQKQGLRAYPMAGYVTKIGDTNDWERGHVWNKLFIDGQWYVIDITLTQFQNYLGLDVPPIVFGTLDEIYHEFSYQEDGRGPYPYRPNDVRPSLVQKLFFNG